MKDYQPFNNNYSLGDDDTDDDMDEQQSLSQFPTSPLNTKRAQGGRLELLPLAFLETIL